MLSPKPWKLEAIVRLLLKVFICVCAGSLLVTVLYAHGRPGGGRWKLIVLALPAAAFFGTALVLLRKPWTQQNLISRGAVALTFFYAGFVLTALAQHFAGAASMAVSAGQMIVGMLSFQGATLILVTMFLRQQGSSWTESFGLSKDTRRAILSGLILACLFLPIGWALKSLSENGIEYFSHAKAAQQQAVETIRTANGWFHQVLLGVLTIILAPLAEETLFRGILYATIRQAGYPRLAFWLTSIAFAAIHFNLAAFFPLLVLAIFLTLLYEKTDNLAAPVTAHAAFNAIEFIYMLAQPQNG